MSGRGNLLLGVFSSAWSAVLALAAVPFYLRFLGQEAYGLIGFFVTMQALFAILDLGLSTTMSREVARCRATGNVDEARSMLQTLGIVYWLTAAAIGALVVIGADAIASTWLRVDALPQSDVRNAIMLMGAVLALRWPIAIYVGALIGAERLAYVSVIAIAITTFGTGGVILVLWLVSPTVSAFFLWQAASAALHVGIVALVAWRELGDWARARIDFTGLRRIWRFSGGLTVTTILGAVFMQSDKVVISRIVSLADLGAYTLAATVARVLYVVLTPAFNIIYPRMTALIAADRGDELALYYREGTRLIIAAIVPFATFIAIFAYPLLLLWTRDAVIAQRSAPLVLPIIAGTALNGIMHFPYAIQLAAGRAWLPATINSLLLVVFLPMLTVLALRYGMYGGALAWFGLNLMYLLLGTWLTHRVILPGLAGRWLLRDVAAPAGLCVGMVAVGAFLATSFVASSLGQLVAAGLVTVIAMAVCALTCPSIRHMMRPRRFAAAEG